MANTLPILSLVNGPMVGRSPARGLSRGLIAKILERGLGQDSVRVSQVQLALSLNSGWDGNEVTEFRVHPSFVRGWASPVL